MKYLSSKALLASFLVIGGLTQTTIDPTNPQWGWSDYKELKCDTGYNQVLNYCVKCSSDSGVFFDPVTKQCRSCPTGTNFNSTSNSCDCAKKPCNAPQKLNTLTGVCECTGGRTSINNTCKCPDNKPLWNGKKCVACPAGTTYEPKDSQCYNCPEGFEADPVTHNCQPALGH